MSEKGISNIISTALVFIFAIFLVIIAIRGPRNPEKRFDYEYHEGNTDKMITIYNEEMVGTELEEKYKHIFTEKADSIYSELENNIRTPESAVHYLKELQAVNNDDVYNHVQKILDNIYAVHGEVGEYDRSLSIKEVFMFPIWALGAWIYSIIENIQ